MIMSKPYSRKGEKNYEKIFKKNKKEFECYCECGAVIYPSHSRVDYRKVEYDELGKIIYAECSHGYVVINEK